MTRFLLPVFFVLLIAGDVLACQRCGLFGNRCRFSKRAVVVNHAVPVVQQQVVPPQTITIQNNYNGQALTSPLAAQGSTAYGYSSAALAYNVDPNQLLSTAARLTENAQRLAEEGFAEYQKTAQLSLTQQGDVAKILAATAHLKAATSSSSQTLKVEVGGSGPPKVTAQPPLEGATNRPTIFASSCVKCHSGAAPKGKFSLDGPTYDPATITKALRVISSGTMPPADSGITLSNEQKGQIMQYLLANDKSAKREEE